MCLFWSIMSDVFPEVAYTKTLYVYQHWIINSHWVYTDFDHVYEQMKMNWCVLLQLAGDWKNLRRAFRKLDTHNEGYLSVPEFRSVLKLANVILDEDEVYHVMTQFDENMSGKIPYEKFIEETFKPPSRHGATKWYDSVIIVYWRFIHCFVHWNSLSRETSFYIVLTVNISDEWGLTSLNL